MQSGLISRVEGTICDDLVEFVRILKYGADMSGKTAAMEPVQRRHLDIVHRA